MRYLIAALVVFFVGGLALARHDLAGQEPSPAAAAALADAPKPGSQDEQDAPRPTLVNAPAQDNAAAAAALAATTPEVADRAAIEAIVRDYLLANPEIIDEAQTILTIRKRDALMERLADAPAEYSIGSPDAPVTVVELFDYRCGYCKLAMDYVFSVAGEDVRVVFREFPILSEDSFIGAQAALAAGRQGQFEIMHKALMESRGPIDTDVVRALARDLGLNARKLIRDMEDPAIAAEIALVRELAGEITELYGRDIGTPTFVINGMVLSGYSEERLNDMIALAKAEAEG